MIYMHETGPIVIILDYTLVSGYTEFVEPADIRMGGTGGVVVGPNPQPPDSEPLATPSSEPEWR